MPITPVNLQKLENIFDRLDIRGVKYGLGAKAPSMTTAPEKIARIDCSGFVRYALAQATDQKLIIPDGSWNQREWAENNLHKVNYRDTNRYMTDRRLFIAFIKPHTNGCGPVGHVWFVCQHDKDKEADTLESHGGVGINSRAWNYGTLYRQVFNCFEIPTK